MPKSSVDALDAIRERNLDALRAVQTAQLAALQSAREITQSFAAAGSSAPGANAALRAMTDLTTTFAFALLEQQIAFGKQLAEVFAPARLPKASEPRTDAPAAAAALPDEPQSTAAQTRALPEVAAEQRDVQSTSAVVAPAAADAQTTGADVRAAIEAREDELLSKTLPAPARAVFDGEPAVHAMPSVSNNGMPPKRKPKKR